MNQKIIIGIVLVLVLVGGGFLLNNRYNIFKRTPVIVVPKNNGQEFVSMGNVVGSMKSASVGEYLTDTKGMTLYTFGDDKKLESVCFKECLENWTPFQYDGKNLASSTDLLSKRMNLIKRENNYYQYAYIERPLYYYDGDKNPGETNGMTVENIQNRWNLVLIQK